MNNERITGAEVIITLKNGSSVSSTITLPETNPTPEYNVGDTVEVKTWVELKYGAERLDEDGSLILKDGVRFVVKDMAEYCGKHIVITEKRKIHDGTYRYGIEGSRYNWTESMFASFASIVQVTPKRANAPSRTSKGSASMFSSVSSPPVTAAATM